jgi:hypothetical protein
MTPYEIEIKAKEHSVKAWGAYTDDRFKHADIITDKTLDEITRIDFTAGVNMMLEIVESKDKEISRLSRLLETKQDLFLEKLDEKDKEIAKLKEENRSILNSIARAGRWDKEIKWESEKDKEISAIEKTLIEVHLLLLEKTEEVDNRNEILNEKYVEIAALKEQLKNKNS